MFLPPLMANVGVHHLVFGHYPLDFTEVDVRRMLEPFSIHIQCVTLFHNKHPQLASVVVCSTWHEVQRIKRELDHMQGLRVKIVY